MTKIFKKIAAIAMAAAMTATMAVSVSAASESVNFTARHYNFTGAPSSLSYSGYASLFATSERYTGTITSMSDISYRTTKITIDNSNGTDFSLKNCSSISYTNTGSRTWNISGTIDGGTKVKYKIDAYTNLSNTDLYVKGTISR